MKSCHHGDEDVTRVTLALSITRLKIPPHLLSGRARDAPITALYGGRPANDDRANDDLTGNKRSARSGSERDVSVARCFSADRFI